MRRRLALETVTRDPSADLSLGRRQTSFLNAGAVDAIEPGFAWQVRTCDAHNAYRDTSRPRADAATTGSRVDVKGGPVRKLLDMAVERSTFDQLEVEVGCPLEDRGRAVLAGDHREQRHLDVVD